MDKLTEALQNAPKTIASGGESFTQAAADWASFVIKNLDDPLLDKALDISAAIARFTCELSRLEGNGKLNGQT